ncbi:MAG: hypothetical protein Q4C45_01800 [Oscillospiraceae bacterium]|nr:hypothetical protein [Oscillospiraceae bacterium]
MECLKTNTYPASFLTNALGFSQTLAARLPRYLAAFIAVYFLCGGITLLLRFKKGQKSLCSTPQQINTVILTWCCTLFVPLLILMVRACAYVLQNEVDGFQGKGDLIRFAGESVASIFYLVMAIVGVAFTVWMPLSTAIRYLRVHRLGGLPHMIFDVGTGMFLLSVLLLSAFYGERRLYLLILPAVVMLRIVQHGGYIPEEKNARASQENGT